MKLNEIIEFNPTRNLKKGENAPFVEMAALAQDSRDISYCFKKEFNGSGTKFKNGDTLLARITPCLENGKTAKVNCLEDDEIAHGSTEFIVLKAKEPEYDEDFIYYLCRWDKFRNYAIARMEGSSGRQRVDWKAIADYDCELPKKEERKQIGYFLKQIDDKIANNNNLNRTLEFIIQTLFQSWFVDFEPVKAKIAAKQQGGDPQLLAMMAISGKSKDELKQFSVERFNELAMIASLFPDELIESPLGKIPFGWKAEPIGELSENKAKTFDFRNKKDVVFLNTGDVLNGKILHNNISSIEILPGQAKKAIEKDDILFSEIRPINRRFAYVSKDLKDHVVSTKFMVIKSNGKLDSRLVYINLKQDSTIQLFNTLAESRSGTFPQITFDTIKHILWVVPEHKVQNCFLKRIMPIINRQELLEKETDKLSLIRDTLIPNLMSKELINNEG